MNALLHNKRTIISISIFIIILVTYLVLNLLIYPQQKVVVPQSQSFTQNNIVSNSLQNSAQDTSASKLDTQEATPEDVTAAFYNDYVNTNNFLSSEAYKTNPWLTSAFKNDIAAALKSNKVISDTGNTIFCQPEKTKDIFVETEQNVPENNARILVHRTNDDKAIYRIVLINRSSTWKIDDIICIP